MSSMKNILLWCVMTSILWHSSYGQREERFFRKDYTFMESMQSFYKIHTFPRDWHTAKMMCEREGASLFYADDESEAKSILKFVKEKSSQIRNMYIGVSARMAKGVFETIDGQPISSVYNKWATGEPNNVGGHEDCVSMKDDGSLNDFTCNIDLPFVCIKPLAELQWNSDCMMPNPEYEYNQELGKCYKFHLDPRNWTEAYAICSAEQSYLAVLDSQEESDFLVNMTAAAPKDNIGGNYLRGAVLLGFQNLDDEGWRTIKDVPLEKSGYSKWSYGQPDFAGGPERCGSMFYGGEFNDLGCQHKCFFICEHDPYMDNTIPDLRFASNIPTTIIPT